MITPIEIARLEEARQAIGVAEVSVESEAIAGGTMCFGGKGSWTNQGQGLGLEGEVSDAELDRFVDYYLSRGVEPKLELCPFADRTLIEGIEKRGFTLLEFENVLIREIATDEQLDDQMPHPWPEGLEIVQVDPDDDERVETFVLASNSGFFPEGETIPELLRETSKRCVAHPRSSAFLALVDGQPVGGGAMEVTPAISSLFGASVLPEYRRRGIQAALILRRLKHAQDHGSPLVAIHSNPGIATERNATRLGFVVAYTKAIMRMSGPGLESSP
jgi:GNAT superfamily N-acetyltransferase